MGQIGSALFGTATTSDVRAIAKANEKLAEMVEGVIVDQGGNSKGEYNR